jgi:NAD(P)-dependent dehydrogenase (short-subunit alcohol dehydrogenase family)
MNFEQAIETAKKNINTRLKTDGRLSGKIAVVTGSAQGFGLGIAKEMFKEGACIVIADLPSQEVNAGRIVKELGERAIFVSADVTDEESVKALMCSAVEHFGGLDVFVSNAGILKAGDIDEMDLKTFELVTKVNYTGFFLCTKYAGEIMKAEFQADKSRFSDIIQINSKSGLVGSKKNFAYSGSKFGGIGLTQSFALELAPYNIKVNAICPGNYYEGPLWSDPENGLFVQYLKEGKVPQAKTVEDVREFYLSKSPIRRGCYPEDVAKAVFYCIEQCYETGQAVPVTGGQTMLG